MSRVLAKSTSLPGRARHGKAVYWDLGSAQSLGTVTADLKPGVARVEAGHWDSKLGQLLEQKSVCSPSVFQVAHVQRHFWNVLDDIRYIR